MDGAAKRDLSGLNNITLWSWKSMAAGCVWLMPWLKVFTTS